MPAPRKYSQELRERSLRLVSEAMAEDPSLSLMFVVPSQAGMELRRPTESRLRTRQRADRVSLESLETAPTAFEPLDHEL